MTAIPLIVLFFQFRSHEYISGVYWLAGLGLGTTVTSGIFLGAIFLTVIYLAVTKKDVTTSREAHAKYL